MMDRFLDGMRPYLREAGVCIVPRVTDDQIERIRDGLSSMSPEPRARRLSDTTVLIEGIALYARSAHEADAFLWEAVAALVRRALGPTDGATGITSIDVRDPVAATA